MKNLLVSFVVASALALGACSGTTAVAVAPATPASPTVAVASPPAPVEAQPVAEVSPPEQAEAPEEVLPTSFSSETWSLNVPQPGWHRLNTPPGILALVNPEMRNLVLLATEDSTRSNSAERAYVISQFTKNAPDATILSSSKKNAISNGVSFASFRIDNKKAGNTTKGWGWVTVQKGVAYTLICSGAENADKLQEKTCATIFSSLKLTNGK